MSQMSNQERTFTTGEAVEKYRRVDVNSSGNLVYADAGMIGIGTTIEKVGNGLSCAVRMDSAGTVKMTAAAAIGIGNKVWPAADGKVNKLPTGAYVGIALEAATADGDIIEVMPQQGDLEFHNRTYETVSDDKTLDIQDAGKVMVVDTDAKTITLPAVAVEFEFVIMNGGASGAVKVAVSPGANDKIMGADLAGVDNKDRINTKATAEPGDYIHINYGSADGYMVQSERGTWAAEA